MKTDSREEIRLRLRRNRGAEFGIRQTIFDFFRVGKQPYIYDMLDHLQVSGGLLLTGFGHMEQIAGKRNRKYGEMWKIEWKQLFVIG